MDVGLRKAPWAHVKCRMCHMALITSS